MASIPLPALDIHPPQQQPGPLEQFGRVQALKAALGQQQLQQEQLRGAQLQNQQSEYDLAATKAVNSSYQDAIKVDENGKPTFDTDVLTQHLSQKGFGSKIPAILSNLTDYETKKAALTKTQQEIQVNARDASGSLGAALKQANYDPQLAHTILQHSLQDPSLQPQMKAQMMQLDAQIDQNPGLVKQFADNAIANSPKQQDLAIKQKEADARASEAATSAERLKQELPGGLLANVDRTEMTDALNKGLIKSASEYPAYKAAQTARAELPYKVETARAEGQARQMIEGMEKPVYAIDAKGNKTLMSATDALQGGIRTMLPVTEKQVSDDIMLTNRLGDVHQKIARYESNFQKPLSTQDYGIISGMLSDDKFKLGAFGAELPVDFINKFVGAARDRGLSDEAQKRVISYFNAREAMTGYNRVLSGSNRSSDKNLELQLETLADPLKSPKYAKEAFSQFKENLGVVGQGLPAIPGVKRPEEFDSAGQVPQANFNIPQPLSAPQSPPAKSGWGTAFGGVLRGN